MAIGFLSTHEKRPTTLWRGGLAMSHPLGSELPPGTTSVHVAGEIGISVYTLRGWVRSGVLPRPEGSRSQPVLRTGHIEMGRDILALRDQSRGLEFFREVTKELIGKG